MTAARVYLRPSEAAQVVSLPGRTLSRALASGELPALRLIRGGKTLYRLPGAALGLDVPQPAAVVQPVNTSRTVADLVRVHYRTVERWAAEGTLPMARVRGSWRLSGPELVRWLDSHTFDGEKVQSHHYIRRPRRTGERSESPKPLPDPPAEASPSPVEIGGFVVPARWFDCPAYDRCLRVAGKHGWTSWDCAACRLCPEGIAAQHLTELPMVGLTTAEPKRQGRVLQAMRGGS